MVCVCGHKVPTFQMGKHQHWVKTPTLIFEMNRYTKWIELLLLILLSVTDLSTRHGKIYNTAKLSLHLLGFLRDPYIGGLAICTDMPIKKKRLGNISWYRCTIQKASWTAECCWQCGISSHSQSLSALHSKQNKECNHQAEKTHGFRQSKTQDGVGEQLLLQRGVPVERREEQLSTNIR